MISYSKFWRLLSERQITQYSLINDFNISPRLLSQLRSDGFVQTRSIDRLCLILDCNPSDLFDIAPD